MPNTGKCRWQLTAPGIGISRNWLPTHLRDLLWPDKSIWPTWTARRQIPKIFSAGILPTHPDGHKYVARSAKRFGGQARRGDCGTAVGSGDGPDSPFWRESVSTLTEYFSIELADLPDENKGFTTAPDKPELSLESADQASISLKNHAAKCLSLPKTRAGLRTPFDQWMLAEAGVLTDSPSYHGDWEGSKMKLGGTVHCPEGPRNE